MKAPKIYCRHVGVWPLKKFKRNPENPNTHPPEQIKRLLDIIRKNGWRMPITVSDRSKMITKGHGRLDAAELGGLREAPYEIQHYATAEEEWADVIADNRLPELGETDDRAMAAAIKDLRRGGIELGSVGFDETEYKALLASLKVGGGAGSRGTDQEPGRQAEGRHTVILHYDDAEFEEFGKLEKAVTKKLELLTASDTMLRLITEAAK